VGNQLQEIPPLSQSRQADMACRCLYLRKHVIGGPMAESQAAARGIEVHQVPATYINHLVSTRRSTDLERDLEIFLELARSYRTRKSDRQKLAG